MGLILEEHMKQKNLIKKYDKQVTMYEKNRENPNMAARRRKIINSAYGNILEVGIGVGANFSHYNKEKVHISPSSPLLCPEEGGAICWSFCFLKTGRMLFLGNRTVH